MSHTAGRALLEELTLAYGLASGYQRGAAALGIPAGRQVRVELLDDAGRLLDWRAYVVPERVVQLSIGQAMADVAREPDAGTRYRRP